VKIRLVENLKGPWGFPKGDISRKIPPDPAVAKYLGFTPVSFWESATNLLNAKYLATALHGNRYRLEESAMAPEPFKILESFVFRH
jgi:hypothetical protein